jgi:hypothetical protein
VSLTAIIRAIYKEFSMSTNCPKGHGKLFLEWVCESGIMLIHDAEFAAGSRQDLTLKV